MKNIDNKTGRLKVILSPHMYKFGTKLFGKKHMQETYLENKNIK